MATRNISGQISICNLSELYSPVIRLREAVARVDYTAKTRKLRESLEKKLAKLFAKQSVAFLKRFAKFDGRFSESVGDDEFDRIVDSTFPESDMLKALQSVVESALETGANALVDQFAGDIGDYVFNLKNPRAVKFIDAYGADQVTGINDTSKSQLRTILHEGIDNGWSYDKIARAMRKQFTDFSVDRARVIATTEIGNAYQEGNMIVGRDLKAAGLQMQKSWLTRNDGKVDPDCAANQDQGWIDVDELFTSGVDRPLDHPRCRCVLLFKRAKS